MAPTTPFGMQGAQCAHTKHQEAIGMIDQALDGRRPVLRTSRGRRGVFLGLRRCGLSIEQAGNLTAHLEGIRAVPGGWTLDEVARLQFTRWLVVAGQLGADDTAADRAPIPEAAAA
jgi:hypothetical protein